MADAITRMQKAVRSEHVDVRMNTRVGGTMITFIKDTTTILTTTMIKKTRRAQIGKVLPLRFLESVNELALKP